MGLMMQPRASEEKEESGNEYDGGRNDAADDHGHDNGNVISGDADGDNKGATQ